MGRFFRIVLAALCVLLAPLGATASEQINDFDVVIDVQRDGDIIVTEIIDVTSEGSQIRRGIFRDLPGYYLKGAKKLPYGYDVTRIERDGRKEPYVVEREGNAFRIKIGDADVFLENGRHVYVIEYEVKNQVRYFDGYDEIYWNATGNYWSFPIEKARAAVVFPDGAKVMQAAAYTGQRGSSAGAYRRSAENSAQIFETTSPLGRREGLTVSVGIEKGAIDPPSAADRRAEWWTINASALVLGGALAALFGFYLIAYDRVGRDPLKGPVFPRYEPPQGFSPAAIHHIFHRRFAGHKALIATILNYAVRDAIRIDAEDKKKTKLTHLRAPEGEVLAEEETLINGAFNGRESFTLGEGYDSAVTSAYQKFQGEVTKGFGNPFFKWNAGFLVFGVVLSVLAVIAAAVLSVGWSMWHTAMTAGLVLLSGVFSYFLPAPTDRGQKIRTEIEGFRLYLDKAEKLQLNAATPGDDGPPPMSVKRYERFLPYVRWRLASKSPGRVILNG